MSITLGAATAYVGQLTGKQAGSIAGKVLSERMWGLKTARASLREVPRPRPRRVLARWLKQPATLRDVLLSPDRPGDSVVAEIDRVLCRNPRWASLPGNVRAERAEKIALGVYDAVLSSHTPAWSTRIVASRTMEKLHQIHDAVERSAAPPPAAESDSAAGAGGSRELLEARLGLAPPEQHETVLAAWGVDQARTWALVCALTDPSVEPSDVVRDWSQVRPQWLAGAGPAVLVAAAELAAAYGQSGWAGHLLLEAAHGGGSPRQVLIARATLLFDGDGRDDAPTVLAKVGTAQESPEPFVRALHALLARDWDRTKAVLAEWEPRDRRERVRKWAIADRLVFLSATSRTVTKEILSESIGLARSLLAETWSDAAALTVAHRLTMRTGLSGSEQPYADLREARGLAVKVRDGCRVWRGDSGTAVAAACEAALHAGDLSAVVDLGTAAGQATPKEASHPEVVARVAVAAAMLGRPVDTAALSALTEHDRERVLAQAARAAGEDDEGHWRAALMAAQDEPQRATALAGLAGTGTLSLPGLDELEAEHPDVAGQIRAIGEIARGQHAQAVSRLRGRARQNAQAAALLAQAYEQAGDIDAAVATFQEAARAFSDPDLAWAAVVALFRGGRHDDAAKTLGGVLASAPDGWPGRAQALHMAARLAAGADDLVRATDLLRTAVELDPSDARRRWHLVELLLSRTDTAAAWRVYAAHPEPLEPRDLAQAHMWLVLQRAEGDPEDLARGAVRLTRRFPDDEGLAARAVALLIAPNPKKDLAPLPPELLSDVHTLVSDYTRRWPEGAIRAITMDEDDPEATLAKVGGMARRGPDAHKDLLRLAGQVARQEIPLGMLAAFAHRPYAEVVVLRGLGILAAGHPDPEERAVGRRRPRGAWRHVPGRHHRVCRPRRAARHGQRRAVCGVPVCRDGR